MSLATRVIQDRNIGDVVSAPVFGGLHNRYYREAAYVVIRYQT